MLYSMCDTSIKKAKCHGVAPRRGESAPLGTEVAAVPTQGAGAGGAAGSGRRVPRSGPLPSASRRICRGRASAEVALNAQL